MEIVYEQAKARLREIETALTAASVTLKSFPRLPNGLTPDAVRAMPEYQAAKARHAALFSNLREFNSQFLKVFKRQIRHERKSNELS